VQTKGAINHEKPVNGILFCFPSSYRNR